MAHCDADDQDAACLDCAQGAHGLCLDDDPAEVGRRSCCCGVLDEIDPWADSDTEGGRP
jgi:hypothetical protein